MPTIQSMELPKPTNWQDFETIVRDAMAQRWKSTTLQKNGRSGQKQNGVDIYGSDDIGRSVGIQCKRYKTPLELKHVTNEIKNAETFQGALVTLFLATTADHDATLQQKVRLLSEKRVAEGKFSVALIFWDEVVSSLLLNASVFHMHYPQLVIASPVKVDKERQLAALELAYFGADIWASVQLMYGEFGWLAQVDPDELIAKLRILEFRAQQLLSPDDALPILQALKKVRVGCLRKKKHESDWGPIEMQAKRASLRIRAASSLLSLEESNVIDLGLRTYP